MRKYWKNGTESPALLQNIKKLKLGYFGHTTRHESLEKHILEAIVEGKRGRGRPTRRWEKDIQDWLGMTTTQASRLAEDRSMFRKTVREATSYKGSADWLSKSSTEPASFKLYETRTRSLWQCKDSLWLHRGPVWLGETRHDFILFPTLFHKINRTEIFLFMTEHQWCFWQLQRFTDFFAWDA